MENKEAVIYIVYDSEDGEILAIFGDPYIARSLYSRQLSDHSVIICVSKVTICQEVILYGSEL